MVIIICVVSALVVTTPVMANTHDTACQTGLSDSQQNRKLYQINLSGFGVITAWGVAKWDYFSRSIHANTEGWFSNDTDDGGVDKIGHLYTGYLTAHGLSYLFESLCFNKQDAALYGSLSSFAILSYMELGDSFSDFGFSYEDLVSNTLGSILGYYLYRNPQLSRKIDIRWEYGFHRKSNDFTTDYENSKYLVAVKLNGFEKTRNSFLKHIELHVGYYTRGFSDPADAKERNLYLGVGINLTDYFKRRSYNKTATFFKYMQLPGTYIEFENDLNE